MAKAVDARKLIGLAMGILMERHPLDEDRAFAVLKRYSQDQNIKLRDVARYLIDTRKLPTGDLRSEHALRRPARWWVWRSCTRPNLCGHTGRVYRGHDVVHDLGLLSLDPPRCKALMF
jgi:hypothetical protein